MFNWIKKHTKAEPQVTYTTPTELNRPTPSNSITEPDSIEYGPDDKYSLSDYVSHEWLVDSNRGYVDFQARARAAYDEAKAKPSRYRIVREQMNGWSVQRERILEASYGGQRYTWEKQRHLSGQLWDSLDAKPRRYWDTISPVIEDFNAAEQWLKIFLDPDYEAVYYEHPPLTRSTANLKITKE